MTKTSIFTFTMLLLVALYDLWVVATSGMASSVSQWIADTTHISPIQAFVAGVLTAHFFGWMIFPGSKK